MLVITRDTYTERDGTLGACSVVLFCFIGWATKEKGDEMDETPKRDSIKHRERIISVAGTGYEMDDLPWYSAEYAAEEMRNDKGPATLAEADAHSVLWEGAEHPEKAWLLSDRDVWYANPYYRGPSVRHPELEGMDDDEEEQVDDDK